MLSFMKIVKVPRINALGLKGPEKAPDFILKELEDSYLGEAEIDEIKIDNHDVEASHNAIYEKSKQELKEGKVVFVGGDHSISPPILKSFGETYGFENSFLIVFDAHADCMEPMKEPTHEEVIKAAVEYGFKPENIILVGVRKIEPEEKKFLTENKIKIFSEDFDLEAAADYITEKAKDKETYVSVDVDVFEPSIAPAVHYPEFLGLSSKEFFYLFRRILHLPNLRAMDIVEVVPSIDEKYDFRTTKLAAKIIQEFLNSQI